MLLSSPFFSMGKLSHGQSAAFQGQSQSKYNMLSGEHEIQKVANGLTLNIRASEGFSEFAFFEQGRGCGLRITGLLM